MTDQPHDPMQPTGPDRPPFYRRPVPLVTIVLALLLAALLPLLFRQPTSEPPEGDAPPTPPVNAVRGNANATGFVYEEYLGAGLEDKVKQADSALLETLRARDIPAASVVLREVRTERRGREEYHYQFLEVPLPGDAAGFAATLAGDLARRLPDAALHAEPDGVWRIDIDGVHTHQLLFRVPSTTAVQPPVTPPPLPGGPGRLAIVIDDLGENISIARALADLPVRVSFAIWPFAAHHDEVRRVAQAKGLEILVHMPMEPESYPKNNPGPDALFVDMDPARIARLMDRNLDKVPGAVGVNNHMGSRFTADYGAMLAALGELKGRGLFFLDSRTIGSSKGPEAAAALGIPFHSRDIFLDNVLEVDAIVLQLRKAERIALTRGWAIAIGHGHPETVRAIRQWAGGKSGALSVVSVGSLPRQ